MARRVRLATLLAFILHGCFIVSARYRLSYDAYTHIFLGDHYRTDWWGLWEPRWYTGFEVSSYPPLVHQLIGLLGHLVGVDAAFALLLWLVLSAYPVAVYAFCRVFTGKSVAGYAALGAALLPAIFEAAHSFGQLPTLMGTLFALFAMAALNDFLRRGQPLSGALAVALIGSVMAAHHATLLFLPWAAGAVVLHLLLNTSTDRVALFRRFCLFALPAAALGLLVIWPFWAWGRGQVMQTPIDHPSRHNFFTDPLAPLAFFLPVYGPLIPLIPVVLWKGLRRRWLGLWIAFLGLFVLGLGGTTPLPRLLFGSQWEWLTYDRFAFWAALVLLPFFGATLVWLRRKRPPRKRRGLAVWIFSALGLAAVIAGLLPTLLPMQPPQVDMKPLADFLADGDHAQWRYVTFGFGDQFASLSLLTTATTIDGSYHTARTLPELRSSGVGQIDTAYWLPDGLSRLDPILQMAGQRGVRWGFLDRIDYVPVLVRNRWVFLTTLSNGVEVWENPQAVPPPPVQPPSEDPLAVFSWGVLPLASLCMTAALAAMRLRPAAAQRALFGIHALAIGLLPVGLSFWYFRTLAVGDTPRVYFTYDNALFYLSDALALVACAAWASGRVFGPRETAAHPPRPIQLRIETWLLGLCLLTSASCLWAVDGRVALAASLHLWLATGLFVTLQDRPAAWRAFALGSVAALGIQAALGFGEFARQSTAFLAPLGLNWPGSLQAATSGASVVQLADGARWLRVYGTLPHPNILGGLACAFLAGTGALYLTANRLRWLLLPVIAAGMALLVLTFARSAWVALAVFGAVLALRYRRLAGKRLLAMLAAGLAGLAAAAIPLRELIFTRTSDSGVSTEAFSTAARTWLAGQGWQFFLEKPVLGWGAGSFVLELARRAALGYIIEPVHNIPLLVASELGIGGALLLAGLAGVVIYHAVRAQRPAALVFAGLVLGLGAIGMVDHYLWTLAPGQVLLGASLGIFAGQVRLDESAD